MGDAEADVVDGAVDREQQAQAQLLEEARAAVRAVRLRRVRLDGELQAPVCKQLYAATSARRRVRLDRRGSSLLRS